MADHCDDPRSAPWDLCPSCPIPLETFVNTGRPGDTIAWRRTRSGYASTAPCSSLFGLSVVGEDQPSGQRCTSPKWRVSGTSGRFDFVAIRDPRSCSDSPVATGSGLFIKTGKKRADETGNSSQARYRQARRPARVGEGELMNETLHELRVDFPSDDRRPDGAFVWPIGTTDNGASETVVPALVRRFQVAAEVLGWIALVLGLVVLVVGWWLGVDIVARVIPGSVTMKANTAVGIGAGGFAIVGHRRGWHRGVVVTMVALVAIIGWVTSVEYFAGIRWSGFDELLAREGPGAVATSNPGRMGANTAINYALLGPALFMLAVRRGVRTRQILTLIVTTIGFVSVLGYALGVAELSGLLAGATQMAVNTSVLHVALGLSILFCHPDLGLMRPVVSKRAGGGVIRMYVPVALGATLLIGLLAEHVLAPLTGNPTFALQLAIVSLIVGAFVMVFVIGRRLDRIDAERDALLERNALLEHLEATVVQLRRSNRDLAEFASVAAHDLQEPLRKVRTFGDQLATRYHDELDDRGRSYIDRMQSAAGRMQTLIDDVLAIARVNTRGRAFEPVDLTRTAQNVVADLEEQIRVSGGRVEVGPLPTIDADPAQMHQLLQNLVSNALKFHRNGEPPVVLIEGGVVREHTNGSDRVCRVTVQDNGIGFESEHAEKIFGVFQRLHGRSEFEGTGIGLSICRRIAERHNGTITATSGPGLGSTFTLTVPTVQSRKQLR